MHTYESGHYLKHSRVHGMIKVHSNWSVSILHVFHFYPPPGHLRHVPQPPTHPCDFHSPSFLSLSSILCRTSFSLHPCLLTPSLIFHSHSAALRLIHKQHHSLQRQKVERGGEGGMEGGLPLLTYWLLHAEGSLKPANPEAERRGGYGGEREWWREVEGWESICLKLHSIHLHPSSCFHSFIHRYNHSFTTYLHNTLHLLHFHRSRWERRQDTAQRTASIVFAFIRCFTLLLTNQFNLKTTKNRQ